MSRAWLWGRCRQPNASRLHPVSLVGPETRTKRTLYEWGNVSILPHFGLYWACNGSRLVCRLGPTSPCIIVWAQVCGQLVRLPNGLFIIFSVACAKKTLLRGCCYPFCSSAHLSIPCSNCLSILSTLLLLTLNYSCTNKTYQTTACACAMLLEKI
jgi:hypothetical protein